MKLAITGQDGFIGYHLYNSVKYKRTDIQLIDFNKHFFESEKDIDSTIEKADIIVHLAGLNRSNDQKLLYDQNILLSQMALLVQNKAEEKKCQNLFQVILRLKKQ